MKRIHRKIMELQARAFDKTVKQAELPSHRDFDPSIRKQLNRKCGQPLAALTRSAVAKSKGAKAKCLRAWAKTLFPASLRAENTPPRRSSTRFLRGETLYGNLWDFKEHVVKTFYPKFLKGVTPKN